MGRTDPVWTAGDPLHRIARLHNSNPNPQRKAIAMTEITREWTAWATNRVLHELAILMLTAVAVAFAAIALVLG